MPAKNVAPTNDKIAFDKPTICGTISEARYSARERRNRKPQPWAVRKLMVVVTLGIMGYAAYVYAGRFSVRLIRSGQRAEGIGLLVPWCSLYLWMLWAYIKVILTAPGNACDYVPKTPQPLLPPTQWEDEDPYREAALADIESGRIGGRSYEQLSGSHTDVNPPAPPPAAHIVGTAPATATNGDAAAPGKAPPTLRTPRGRQPPATAPLLPPNRWCSRCAIVKPYRAHHCRVCGTCILKFDHHCPWIGQCVGARNHKFFINFAVATFVFTSYTFASLLALNVANGDVDPQEVVIIALAALFALFTATLGVAHTRMLVLSQTTVESLGVQRLKERESTALAADGVGWWELGAKRRARAAYDREWGAPDTEGNLWWAGSARAGWEDAMGKSVWGWIFPVGAPLGDGLDYRPNPRFDANGRWRRRSEWPAELR
ncbi:DHHC palmitoyltransferase-domain-containing protein [Mycena pura]|uniref:Palmitoyltransferase n=1 Tax=Mycena pura TaxID=153505 RepID=A0AAD6VA24_9AGAR|nr:DHHC palmitoyltransferase-domain-containing protein [Mycena pura]